MNSFYEHHKDNIRFHYRCFDRILLNGLIQPFQRPKRVIGFSLLPDVTLLTCAQISRFNPLAGPLPSTRPASATPEPASFPQCILRQPIA
jgi:hypothetical protein